MAAQVDHQNSILRTLNGQPVRPEQATPEMIRVAEKMIKIMVESGHAQGYFGDKGDAFATDQVNWLLRDFVLFTQTQTKADYDKVNSNVQVLGSRHISEYDPALIEQYARFSGYAVKYVDVSIVGVTR